MSELSYDHHTSLAEADTTGALEYAAPEVLPDADLNMPEGTAARDDQADTLVAEDGDTEFGQLNEPAGLETRTEIVDQAADDFFEVDIPAQPSRDRTADAAATQRTNNEAVTEKVTDYVPDSDKGVVEKTSLVGSGDGNGIPESVFTPGFNEVVTTPSGDKMRCTASSEWVTISQNDDPNKAGKADFFFTAYLQSDDERTVSFSTRTEMNGARHPDLAAGKLLGRAVDHFDDQLGPDERVEVIEGHWYGDLRTDSGRNLTDNWDQYTGHLTALGPGPYTEEQKAAAAAVTKTGQMAAKLGFTEIFGHEIKEPMDKAITVKFRRPGDVADAAASKLSNSEQVTDDADDSQESDDGAAQARQQVDAAFEDVPRKNDIDADLSEQARFAETFERQRQLLAGQREAKVLNLERAKERASRLEAEYERRRGEPAPPGTFSGTVAGFTRALDMVDGEIEFLRPSSDEDVTYRQTVVRDLAPAIRDNIPGDLPLRFHGSHIYTTRDILASGEISSSAQRIGVTTSFDSIVNISVTTKDNVECSINDFTDITARDCCVPPGCIFALLPADKEDQDNGERSAMGNVNLRERPDQLFGIMTARENVPRVQQWATDAGINPSKVFEFFEFANYLYDL